MASVAQKSSALFSSSLGKKYLMGLTGLFLITFLLVHCFINAMVFFDTDGKLFNSYAHLMGTNILIRIMEVGLFGGLLLHIIDGLMLFFQNRAARPQQYAYVKHAENITWYSRSMALLGTLLLIFLILHLSHFWVHSRFMESSMSTMDHPDFKVKMLVSTQFFQGLSICILGRCSLQRMINYLRIFTFIDGVREPSLAEIHHCGFYARES